MSRREIWLEKYRPKTLDEVKGQNDIIESIKRQIDNNDVPNLLFSGPPGVGKTATALAIAREIYGDNWNNYFLELNASDKRGIDVIRDDVKNFARTASNENYRIIFLDESDALTNDAQSALRRTMEKLSGNVRFILSCNYPSKIISPIQSRCTVNRFKPLSDDAIRNQIIHIINEEDMKLSEDAIEAIIYTSDNDMRRAVNTLQSVSNYSEEVDKEIIYNLTNSVKPKDVKEIINKTQNREFLEARELVHNIMINKGIVSTELLDQIHTTIWNDDDISDNTAVQISNILGEIDYRISQGANEKIQMDSFISELCDVNDR